MTDLDDALARARTGDTAAFDALFMAFQPPLMRFLRGVALDACDDIAGEVWLDVVRGLRGFRGDATAFRSWLFTIAHRRVIDARRARRRRPETPMADPPDVAAAPDTADVAEAGMAAERAAALIAALPAEQAEVVLLRVVAGLDVAAVAAILGRRPGTVRVQSHRGLRRLSDMLTERDTAVTHPTRPAM